VRIFRVDNPHTKSVPFWQWCIGELRKDHPDLIFLAEAFTRPKLMYLLAKVGFTQSYTYFTWRNTRRELEDYLATLTTEPVRHFFRPNFWPNTPDILPEHLQHAGRGAFALRLVLAATLSSNYGIYGPAFEHMLNEPRAGAEEYVANEKYELKAWALDRADTLVPLIARINTIRRQNPALHGMDISFHSSESDQLLCFAKHGCGDEPTLLVVVNLDAHRPQSGWIQLDTRRLGIDGEHAIQLHDLLSDARYFLEGQRLFVRLDPAQAPAHIFRLRRRVRTEHDFDYFA
jgi:starch synthase (maltosyl-transferring)